MCCRVLRSVFSANMPSDLRCKACSRASGRLKDMNEFDRKLKMSIKACFSLLTAIEVKEDEKICQKCFKTLMKCSEFVEMCEATESGATESRGNMSEASETEIEEVIEGETKEEVRSVRFEEPLEEVYESDFEPQTSEDEGIEEEGRNSRALLRFYCTVCRRKFPTRDALISHINGISLYSWVLSF